MEQVVGRFGGQAEHGERAFAFSFGVAGALIGFRAGDAQRDIEEQPVGALFAEIILVDREYLQRLWPGWRW